VLSGGSTNTKGEYIFYVLITTDYMIIDKSHIDDSLQKTAIKKNIQLQIRIILFHLEKTCYIILQFIKY